MALGLADIDIDQIVGYSDLAGWWPLNEDGASDDKLDWSGNGLTGTPNGTGGTNDLPQPNSSLPAAIAVLGKSLNFDGSDDLVNLGDNRITGNWSVSLWAKANDVGISSVLIGGTFATNGDVAIKSEQYNNTGKIGVTRKGFFDRAYASNTPFGVWSHYGLASNGSSILLYLDGTYAESTYLPLLPFDFNAIGAWLGGTDSFSGLISDVRVYSATLSAEQYSSIYSGDIVSLSSPTRRTLQLETRLNTRLRTRL